MSILGSCAALNLPDSGCCDWKVLPCITNGCYCDDVCHISKDCCSDITDIGCHPATSIYLLLSSSPIVSPTSTDTLGKAKSDDLLLHQSQLL